jgi:hypothetical protein
MNYRLKSKKIGRLLGAAAAATSLENREEKLKIKKMGVAAATAAAWIMLCQLVIINP